MRRAVVVLICVLSAVLAPVRPAGAQQNRSLVWAALGDSYSSGEGIPDTPDSANPPDRNCERAPSGSPSGAAWPGVAFEEVRRGVPGLVQAFVACTGATSADATWQLAEAKARTGADRFDIVTMSFGGNDIGFADIIQDCIDLPGIGLASGCGHSEARIRQRIDMLVGTAAPRSGELHGSLTLPGLYDHVAEHVNPGGHVFVTGYPHIVEEAHRWPLLNRMLHDCQRILSRDVPTLRSAAGYLNEQIALAVHAANDRHRDRNVSFHWIDISTDVYETGDRPEDRHALCGGEQWINGLSAGVTSGVVRKERSYHPTANGHAATGAVVAQRIRDSVDFDELRRPPSRASSELVLRDTGIGPWDFGTATNVLIAELSAHLGRPDRDTGWHDLVPLHPDVITGEGRRWGDDPEFPTWVWNEPRYRTVCWRMLCSWHGSNTGFSGWDFSAANSGDWNWELDVPPADPPLSTARGISVGTSVADLREAHPDVVFHAGEAGVVGYELPGWTAEFFDGVQSGMGRIHKAQWRWPDDRPAFGPNARVLSIESGRAPIPTCC